MRFLYDSTETGDSNFKPLTWKLRMSIALGVAKGLAYLHSSEARVIYRDLKASNILIDSVSVTIWMLKFIVNLCCH